MREGGNVDCDSNEGGSVDCGVVVAGCVDCGIIADDSIECGVIVAGVVECGVILDGVVEGRNVDGDSALTVDLRIYCGVTSYEGYITGPAHQRRLRCGL